MMAKYKYDEYCIYIYIILYIYVYIYIVYILYIYIYYIYYILYIYIILYIYYILYIYMCVCKHIGTCISDIRKNCYCTFTCYVEYKCCTCDLHFFLVWLTKMTVFIFHIVKRKSSGTNVAVRSRALRGLRCYLCIQNLRTFRLFEQTNCDFSLFFRIKNRWLS